MSSSGVGGWSVESGLLTAASAAAAAGSAIEPASPSAAAPASSSRRRSQMAFGVISEGGCRASFIGIVVLLRFPPLSQVK